MQGEMEIELVAKRMDSKVKQGREKRIRIKTCEAKDETNNCWVLCNIPRIACWSSYSTRTALQFECSSLEERMCSRRNTVVLSIILLSLLQPKSRCDFHVLHYVILFIFLSFCNGEMLVLFFISDFGSIKKQFSESYLIVRYL